MAMRARTRRTGPGLSCSSPFPFSHSLLYSVLRAGRRSRRSWLQTFAKDRRKSVPPSSLMPLATSLEAIREQIVIVREQLEDPARLDYADLQNALTELLEEEANFQVPEPPQIQLLELPPDFLDQLRKQTAQQRVQSTLEGNQIQIRKVDFCHSMRFEK